MKQYFLFIILFWASTAFAQYREWHVTVDANPTTGQGTEANPWTLQTALSQPNNVVKPGDTVWLHGGTYTNHYTCSLQGTPTNFIKVASYPGEWAVLNGNIYPFIPETVTPFVECANAAFPQLPQLPQGDDESDIGSSDLDDELNDNLLDYTDPDPLAININSVLRVTGSNVKFQDFEITCIGAVNKVLNPCFPNNGFHKITGIYHSSSSISNTKCIFANLYIHDLPGEGIGSWKNTEDTEIYGCSIFNNGYVLFNDSDCLSDDNDYLIFGKGPGIYTQNASTLNRQIRNNFIMNNYDSGLLLWSATSQPLSDYVKNFKISNNTIFNNGNPGRRHKVSGTGTDSKPNLVIDSKSGNQFNHPSGIYVLDNVFYLNSRGSWIAGPRIGNSNGIELRDNSIFKGTSGAAILGNNKNLTFTNNLYMGKRIQDFATPTWYSGNGYVFNANQYLTRNSTTSMNMYQIPNPGSGPSNYFVPLLTFQSNYGGESSSSVIACADGAIPMLTSSSMVQNSFVVQNIYNPNVFYVTIHNPRPDIVNNIDVNFSAYNIPYGKEYTVKDAQNFDSYFSTNAIVTTNYYIASNGGNITFPMGLTTLDFAPYNVTFYDRCPEHTPKDFATFIVEFGCKLIPHHKILSDITESELHIVETKNTITLGSNYITSSGSTLNAYAGKEIKVIPDTHLKFGSNVLLKIENHCPDLNYFGEAGTSKQSTSATNMPIENEEKDIAVIYPNPNLGIFKIDSLNETKIKQVTIQEVNSAKTIFEQSYKLVKTVDINISSSPSGIYIVKILLGDNSSTIKSIIKK